MVAELDEVEPRRPNPFNWAITEVIDYPDGWSRVVRARFASSQYVVFEVVGLNHRGHGRVELDGHIRTDGTTYWKSSGDGVHQCLRGPEDLVRMAAAVDRAFGMARELLGPDATF